MDKKILSILVGAGVVSFNADGSIDLSATAEKVKGLIQKEQEENLVLDTKIEAALDTVFDTLGMDTVPSPTLTAMAAVSLAGNNPAMIPSFQASIAEYLGRSARFVGKRGRNGGIVRQK
jgi:dihydrodipicolinate synthase/N-acetylneuraminate lyase